MTQYHCVLWESICHIMIAKGQPFCYRAKTSVRSRAVPPTTDTRTQHQVNRLLLLSKITHTNNIIIEYGSTLYAEMSTYSDENE